MSYRRSYYGPREPRSLRTRNVITIVIAIMLCVFIGSPNELSAQVIHIPADHPSIQSGIDQATDGDTILISEGTYFENINFRGKAITVASLYYIDGDTSHIRRTVIDGSRCVSPDTASVVTMWSGEDTTSILAGLTITGGRGTFLRNVHQFEQFKHWTYQAGGGILILNSGGKIIHNIIEGNHVSADDSINGPMGSGLFALVCRNHDAIIRNNIFRDNTGKGIQGWGGAMGLFGGKFLVEKNFIYRNSVTTSGISCGAGIFYTCDINEGTNEEITIRNNYFLENANYSKYKMGIGGGVAMGRRFDKGIIHLHNNIFSSNYVNGFGGGIYSFDTNGLVYKNFLFNNSATLFGDAISMDDQSAIKVDHNTIWKGKSWILSSYGIADIIPGYLEIEDFKFSGVIGITPFCKYFSIDPESGMIFMGEKDGFITINPEISNFNVFVPPVVIVDFNSVNPGLALQGIKSNRLSANRTPLLKLSHGESNLIFKVEILDNYNTSGHQLWYFMKGVDRDTIYSGTEQHIQYSNLSPGRYKFWIGHAEKGGSWQESLSLNLHIYPPWYRSIPAYGGYLAFLTILILMYIRYRIRKFKVEKIILENEIAKQTMEINRKSQQIIEMEQMRTRFFTDISHEIRTPLSLIVGPLENLMRKGINGAPGREWLGLIKRNSERLSMLVSQLLDISRMDAGYMKLLLEENDIIKHLKILISEYSSLAERKNIQYIVEIPDRRLETYYDKEKMERITSNLLSNAFKFTQEGGIITCRIKIYKSAPGGPDNTVRIIIADTGPGIPMSDRHKIFDRYFKSEGAEYNNRGGIGIGLSLTKDLAGLMHGSIVVKSSQGTGTIFFATLPLGIDHLEEKEYIIKSQNKPGHQAKVDDFDPSITTHEDVTSEQETQILVVEDHDELREFIRESLSDNYTILEAVDSEEALKLAHEEIPDLIITDIMMPGMDGTEMCRRIKSDERTSHIPVIILTAKSTEKDKIEGLEMGADAYMFKPFSIEELSVRINNLMEQRDRLRKRYSNMIGMDWRQISEPTLDEQFLKKVNSIIIENMKDFDFDVTALQEKLLLSRSHLFRKIKALTGESPGSLIRIMRLKTAASIIANGNDNITEISMNVGISNLSYFAKCFKDYYGKTPREYKNSISTGSQKVSD